MKKVCAVLTVVLAFTFLSLYAGEWTGTISDAKCAAAKGEDAGHAGCAKKCIEGGQDAVFASAGKVYKLDKQDEAKKFAGEKVVLKGTAEGDSIKVESISKAK